MSALCCFGLVIVRCRGRYGAEEMLIILFPTDLLIDGLTDWLLFFLSMQDASDVKKNLEQESRRASHLIIWTDCDREGEHIGYEIANICRAVNGRLIVKRARFSSITAQYDRFEALCRILCMPNRCARA